MDNFTKTLEELCEEYEVLITELDSILEAWETMMPPILEFEKHRTLDKLIELHCLADEITVISHNHKIYYSKHVRANIMSACIEERIKELSI